MARLRKGQQILDEVGDLEREAKSWKEALAMKDKEAFCEIGGVFGLKISRSAFEHLAATRQVEIKERVDILHAEFDKL